MIDGPDWRQLPPLTALRAFEAAARLQSFSAAARALSVTPAAVAQQVRALEGLLATELLYREGRGLRLTGSGEDFARVLTEAFRSIETGIAGLRAGREGGPLRVTMTPGFARSWLMPRLGVFWAEHPDVPLIIHSSLAVTDLRREGIDLAIRFGAGKWPGVEAEHLSDTTDLVVASPALIEGRLSIGTEDLQALPWVLQTDMAEDIAALRALGLDPDALDVRPFPTADLCIAAAIEGYGLTFATDRSVAGEVASGRLVSVASLPVAGLAYYIVTLPGPQRADVRKFRAWLRRQFRAEAA